MISLVLNQIKRVLKRRDAVITLLLLPLVCGITKKALPSNTYVSGAAWICPFACALIASAFLWLQKVVDDTIGLTDAVANTPCGHLAGVARVVACVIITAIPTLILVFIACCV